MPDKKKTPKNEPPPIPTEDEHGPGLRVLTESEKHGPTFRIGTRLRNYILTGLIIVGPVGITLYVLYWFVGLVDYWVKPLVPEKYLPDTYLPFAVPGVGLIVAIAALMLIGALTANLFGRTVFGYGEMMLDRMPLVRNLYRALKQIFETVLSQSNNSFQDVGLIEYPRRGLHAIVFISTETTGEIRAKADDGEGLVSVFLPTTPNPTSGFLLFVPKRDVQILEMSVEEAAKLVISAGLVVPEYQEELAGLAEEARARPKTPLPETEPA